MGRALRGALAGGSQRLAHFLSRYGSAIEADLAFRGWDLAQLWKARRWRFLLNLIDHLPRGTAFAEAVAEDDELAAQHGFDGGDKRRAAPPVSEFTPDVELLAALYDRIGVLIGWVAAGAGAKKPPKAQPWPRPVTAIERARSRRARADFEDIVAKAAPHEVRSGDT